MYSTDFLKIRPPVLTDTHAHSQSSRRGLGEAPAQPANQHGAPLNKGNRKKLVGGPEFLSSGK